MSEVIQIKDMLKKYLKSLFLRRWARNFLHSFGMNFTLSARLGNLDSSGQRWNLSLMNQENKYVKTEFQNNDQYA